MKSRYGDSLEKIAYYFVVVCQKSCFTKNINLISLSMTSILISYGTFKSFTTAWLVNIIMYKYLNLPLCVFLWPVNE